MTNNELKEIIEKDGLDYALLQVNVCDIEETDTYNAWEKLQCVSTHLFHMLEM